MEVKKNKKFLNSGKKKTFLNCNFDFFFNLYIIKITFFNQHAGGKTIIYTICLKKTLKVSRLNFSPFINYISIILKKITPMYTLIKIYKQNRKEFSFFKRKSLLGCNL